MSVEQLFSSRYLSKLRDDFSSSTATIIKASNDTSYHVNALLDQDRLQYVRSENGDVLAFLGEDEYAFPFKRRYIHTELDEYIEIPPSGKIEMLQDAIVYEDNKYYSAQIEEKKYIGICDKDNQHIDKIQGDYYTFFDDYNKKYYVDVKDIKKDFENAGVTSMSIMEITGLPKSKLNIKFLAGYFPGTDMNSPVFLEHVNRLFSEAKKFLKKRAPILSQHKPFMDLENMEFLSHDDIISFFKKTNSSDRRESVTYCTLLKFMFLLNKYYESPIFKFLEKCYDDDNFLFEYIRYIFNLPKDTDFIKDDRGVVTFTKTFPEYKHTEITVTVRIKSLDSILQKSLGSASYLNLEDFGDLFGVSVYIPEKLRVHKLDIMKQFDTNLMQGDAYIKNKGGLDLETIEERGVIPKKYQKAIENGIQRNDSSSDNYTDVKEMGTHSVEIRYPFRINKKVEVTEEENKKVEVAKIENIKKGKREKIKCDIGMEVKILDGEPMNDVNEKGLSCHLVFDYFSKHFEGERNRNPFITAKNLSYLFYDFFQYIVDNIHKYPSKTICSLLREIDDDLPKENVSRGFPCDENSKEKVLKDFYESKIMSRLFLYYADKFELQRMSYVKEIVFTTKYNREQLRAGGRGYQIKSS